MSSSFFEVAYCKGQVQAAKNKQEDDGDLLVQFEITEPVDNNTVHWVAAAPMDRRASASGSGLPFYNAVQAFEGTPNRGASSADAQTGKYTVPLQMPNSYYTDLGAVLVPPTVFVSYTTGGGRTKRTAQIRVGNPVPFRTLTYPHKRACASGVGFYGGSSGGWDLPVRTQEQVLRDSGYPRKDVVPDPFWGLKPPL